MIKKYLSFVKFSHTIFAMPFALIGFFLAVKIHEFDFKENYLTFILIIADMIFARNAAMGFNRLLDRNIDKRNKRTANREIPAGKITEKNAIAFVIINSVLFITATYFINNLVFYLSPIALLVILGYSYTKRFTFLCHFILGLGLSLAPIGAYLAVTAEFAWIPVFVSLAVLFWTAGFDIIYSLQDEEFDSENKLKSVPVLMGKRKALILSSVLHLLSAGFIILLGIRAAEILNVLYWIGVSVFILSLIFQHSLVKPNDISKVNLAFFTTNGIASILFACFTITDVFL